MVQSQAKSVEQYLGELPEEQRAVMAAVRDLVREHLPDGYREVVGWGMISYEIPLERYPDTYNGKPLCYVGLAAQKNHLALYLMGVYMNPEQESFLREAFRAEGKKLDLGKSCLRFRRVDDLPLDALAKLIASTSVADYLACYEAIRRQPRSPTSRARK